MPERRIGYFDDEVIRNQPLIENILGNLDDVIKKTSYNEAMKEVGKYSGQRKQYNKFMALNSRYKGTNLDKTEMMKPVEGQYDYVDMEDPNNLNNFMSTNAYKKYNEYVDKTKQEKPEETPQNLRDYIESNPEHKQELINSGFLKQRQVPLTPEELSGKVYEKAGFTPEDKDFYEQFKKSNFDVQGHNDAIREMLYKKAPGLISRGKEGTRLMDLYSQRLASETITPQAPTVYGYTSLGNDKMLKHDSYGNYEVIDLGTGKPDKTMDPKNWEVEKVGDKYYWSQWAQDKNGWNKKLIKELTPTEMEDYQQGLKDEDVDRQLKEKRLSGGTSRSRRGGKKTKTPEQQIVGKTVATLSKLGLTHSGQKWDDWEEKDKDTYEKAFKWMQENTDLEDDEIHSAIKKYEETGKIPDDLFDAGDDEENTDNGDDNPEEDYFSEALNEIDKNDKYDNTEKSARMRMAFEHYKQKEKSKDKISGARKTYLKKIGAY